jgi:hypothetical protein
MRGDTPSPPCFLMLFPIKLKDYFTLTIKTRLDLLLYKPTYGLSGRTNRIFNVLSTKSYHWVTSTPPSKTSQLLSLRSTLMWSVNILFDFPGGYYLTGLQTKILNRCVYSFICQHSLNFLGYTTKRKKSFSCFQSPSKSITSYWVK